MDNQYGPLKANVSGNDFTSEPSRKISQLVQIQQWRQNLHFLKHAIKAHLLIIFLGGSHE
jgi:hypothetical protein